MKKTLIILSAVFIAAMAGRIIFLEAAKNKETVSIENIWKTEGRPVDVFTVKEGSIDITTLVSGRYENKRIMLELTPDKAAKIKTGQKFSSDSGISGTVAKVSARSSRLSGLHAAELSVESGSAEQGGVIRTEIRTGIIEAAVIVLRECVVDGKYIWINENGSLKKRNIKVLGENSKYTAVSGELSAGEQAVVYYGEVFTEGEKVSVHKETGE